MKLDEAKRVEVNAAKDKSEKKITEVKKEADKKVSEANKEADKKVEEAKKPVVAEPKPKETEKTKE